MWGRRRLKVIFLTISISVYFFVYEFSKFIKLHMSLAINQSHNLFLLIYGHPLFTSAGFVSHSSSFSQRLRYFDAYCVLEMLTLLQFTLSLLWSAFDQCNRTKFQHFTRITTKLQTICSHLPSIVTISLFLNWHNHTRLLFSKTQIHSIPSIGRYTNKKPNPLKFFY